MYTTAILAVQAAQFDWSPVLGVTAVITVILAAAVTAGAAFIRSRNTQIVTNYREAAQAWQARSDAQSDEMKELHAQLADRDKQIADLQKQVTELRGHMQALQDMMVGGSAMETLRAHIDVRTNDILAAIGGR